MKRLKLLGDKVRAWFVSNWKIRAIYGEALISIAITVLGSLLPIFFGAIRLYSEDNNLPLSEAFELIKDGELYLYSAALAAPAIYLFHKNSGKGISGSGVFIFISIATIVLSTYCLNLLEFSTVTTGFFILSSLVLYALSLITAYRAQFIEYSQQGGPDLRKSEEQRLSSLDNEFDELQEKV